MNLRVSLNIFLMTVSAKNIDANWFLGGGRWGSEKTRLIALLPRFYEKIELKKKKNTFSDVNNKVKCIERKILNSIEYPRA